MKVLYPTLLFLGAAAFAAGCKVKRQESVRLAEIQNPSTFEHSGGSSSKDYIVEVNGWAGVGEYANEQARLFHNRGDGTFDEIAGSAGLDHFGQGRTVVALDADGDGDDDLLISNNRGPLQYYRNDTEGGSWLRVRLETSAMACPWARQWASNQRWCSSRRASLGSETIVAMKSAVYARLPCSSSW